MLMINSTTSVNYSVNLFSNRNMTQPLFMNK